MRIMFVRSELRSTKRQVFYAGSHQSRPAENPGTTRVGQRVYIEYALNLQSKLTAIYILHRSYVPMQQGLHSGFAAVLVSVANRTETFTILPKVKSILLGRRKDMLLLCRKR